MSTLFTVTISLPAAVVALVIGQAIYKFGAFLPEALAFIATYFVLHAVGDGVARLAGVRRPAWSLRRVAVRPPAVVIGIGTTHLVGPLGGFLREMVVFFAVYAVVVAGGELWMARRAVAACRVATRNQCSASLPLGIGDVADWAGPCRLRPWTCEG